MLFDSVKCDNVLMCAPVFSNMVNICLQSWPRQVAALPMLFDSVKCVIMSSCTSFYSNMCKYLLAKLASAGRCSLLAMLFDSVKCDNVLMCAPGFSNMVNICLQSWLLQVAALYLLCYLIVSSVIISSCVHQVLVTW